MNPAPRTGLPSVKTQLTTLIVDDEAPVAEELASYLTRRGLRTRTASSAREALDQIAAYPDIGTVVADIRMPGGSGLDLAAQLRQWKTNSDDPGVVMMTAHGTMDDAIVALRLGAVEFLRKPFRMSELEQVVRRAQARTLMLRGAQPLNAAEWTSDPQAWIDPLDPAWDANPATGLQSHSVVLNALSVLESAPSSQLACLVLCQIGPRNPVTEDAADHPPGQEQHLDELRRELIRRLQQVGNVGDLICQAGDNNFMILRTNATMASCARWVEILRSSLCSPFRLGEGMVIQPDVYVGAAHSFQLTGQSTGSHAAGMSLRKAAQAALAEALGGAAGRVRWFHAGQDTTTLINDVRPHGTGIGYSIQDLELRFQPIVSLSDRHLAGLEVLLRHKDGERGTITASDIVARAELNGATRELDEYVLRTALSKLREWRAQFGFAGYLNINICPASFADRQFSALIKAAVRELGLSPSTICLEVIESSITDFSVIDQLSSLRMHGFRIAIDDFGWGFSSLSRLLELPADVVKFDRKFLHQSGSPAELREFLLLAHNLVKSCNIDTLAEGVESESDWCLARDVGFDFAQGHWLGVPLMENDVAELLTGC